MPQRSQHPLVYILLIWTSILSVILLVFITLFFTHGQSSISSTVGHTSPLHSTSLDSAKILNFQAQGIQGTISAIQWEPLTKSPLVIEKPENPFQLLKDGEYILNFQVTLSPCVRTPEQLHTVTLKLSGKPKLISWINNQSNSTGLLSKSMFISGGSEVEFTVDPPACMNKSITVTYLDIILLNNL